jgi:hypothetical protein
MKLMAKALANNADDYTSGRIGIFFPASSTPWPGTGNDGDLTGQCVTLNKWFLAEMTDVPAPFSARGHARYFGDTLVSQGHAIEVSAANARRGDFVIWQYGQYGHIAVLLSNGRIFQQNALVTGAASKIVAGSRVYASTVVKMYPILGGVAPRFYRIKTYKEKGKEDMVTASGVDRIFRFRLGRAADAGALKSYVGKHTDDELDRIVKESAEYKNLVKRYNAGERFAKNHMPSIIRDQYVEGAVGEWDVDRIFRFRLGRKATDAENKKFIGKMTDQQVDNVVRDMKEYKDLPKKVKDGSFVAKNHLPSVVRDVYVEPTGETPILLQDGIYKVESKKEK